MNQTSTNDAKHPLDAAALDQLFRSARTYNGWQSDPLSTTEIQQIYDLAKLGPTSANSNPARIVWAHSSAAKEKAAGCVFEGNVSKVLSAAVVAIIGFDTEFHNGFDHLMPFAPDKYRAAFNGSAQLRYDTAFRNSSLQGAYLIIAARSLGYDCGPISGFDHAKVNQAFFEGTTVQANFLCCIGHGSAQSLLPRNPRFSFEQVNKII